jgi:predicted O-methyltransferase YrrM
MPERAIQEIEMFLKHRERGDEPVHVMEHGAGTSTVWLAERCDYLLSFETDPKWYSKVGNWLRHLNLLSHTDLIFASVISEIGIKLPRNSPRAYDLIIVDGRGRLKFWEKARKYLKPGGMVVWDDAERAKYAPAIGTILDTFDVHSIDKGEMEKEYYHNGVLSAKRWVDLPEHRKNVIPRPYLLIARKPWQE